MQKLLIPTILLLFCAHVTWAALVSGTVRNAAPGTTVEIVVPHFYLDGRIARFQGVLDGDSKFSIQTEVPEPGVAFFVFNNDRLPIFLSADDTLIIKTDAFQFPVSVSFGGKNGGNNRLFQEYLKQNQLDFNEFNNIRFKIGQTWVVVEEPMSARMESLEPTLFKGAMDAMQSTSTALIDDFLQQNPDAINPVFRAWLNTEITFSWAYHLLVYGQVYAGRYNIQPDFFDFLYDAPMVQDMIGSDWYRQFLLAFIARQQVKTGRTDHFWSGQYHLAEKLLSGKSLAFFRSELIATAFSEEHLAEVLPLYTHFLQKNPFPLFDDKVEGLYQKYARVSPGAMAPAFDGVDHAGKQILLAQFKGKIVYLNFWASWCGACLRKMEFFDEFHAELTNHGIIIINISVDENPANWEAALNAHPFKGYQLLASSAKTKNIALEYGVEAVPQYFIIDKQGLFETKAASGQPNDIRQRLLDISAK